MSFFKKMLASVGIGSAQVNTELDSTEVSVGGLISGTVYLEGGKTEQRIDRIYLLVKSEYVRKKDDQLVKETATIAKYLIAEGFMLQPEMEKEVEFSFTLPDQMPITLRNAPVWIETGLDIEMAVDPTDRDLITVAPNDGMQTVLDALDLLGFQLREVTNDYAPRLGGPLPFVQEFEFVPGRAFRGQLDELEVLFFPDGSDLELLLQIDRRARGLGSFFAEALELDEQFVRVALTESDLRRGAQSIADRLEEIISDFV